MGVLRYREFRLLFTGQLVSLFGDGLFAVALSFAVLEQTGSKSGLGIVLAAGALPLVAFLLVGGVWADRLSRRRVMLAADGARMAIQGVLAALVLSGNASLGIFIVLYGLYGVAMAFFSPASTGLIPETLPAEELQTANGLLGMTRSVTAVAGGAAGGLLVDAVGPGSAIALDSATFAVSAFALALMRVGAVSATARERFAHELAVGWREVRSRRWVWMEILVVALYLMLYVAPFEVVGPIVSRESLGGPVAWGLISASFAAGMAAGGLGMMLIRLRRPMVVASRDPAVHVRLAAAARLRRASCPDLRRLLRGGRSGRNLDHGLGDGPAARDPRTGALARERVGLDGLPGGNAARIRTHRTDSGARW